ncbi:HI0933-like protein [Aquimixticola soesokkakensis]|uniref:HI0933-like protein n=1 Tax=Aquimixticola soesokkakensis TaxID=1519096 RepID=A0A1Y5TP90_9RHOB|nr:TIGR03862 family flavoprotein [Aquimixticola soesokkakensis]SLN68733.1 HI0933-like protein [Aquimixticola soesokkakensis]
MAERVEALVIGAGPAGLMAADVLSAAGVPVVLAEAKPSPARKFLMAGKSGLNITMDAPLAQVCAVFEEARSPLGPMLAAFGPQEVMQFCRGLGQEVFTGSSGRVFPAAMKGSPLLRAWLARLSAQGVVLRRRWRWSGLSDGFLFETPDGPLVIRPKVTVLALGGASWARLGSDGAWAGILRDRVPLAPFAPANAALSVAWSSHMAAQFGQPVKDVALHCGAYRSRGEFVISQRGLEGSGIYAVSKGIRAGHPLVVDLKPDWPLERVRQALTQGNRKASVSNMLRKALHFGPEKLALVMEYARGHEDLASAIKALTLGNVTLRPLDEAISTAGGIRWEAVTGDLELKAMPRVFAAGEMLDWEAPTGGYLLTACLATGRQAGLGALKALS